MALGMVAGGMASSLQAQTFPNLPITEQQKATARQVAERLADHLVLLREGRVLASGPLELLQADPSLPIARTLRQEAVA